ncbi:MAG: SMP-30/gluconolactonase/LRE family protein [Methyloligellaceae bacterium]
MRKINTVLGALLASISLALASTSFAEEPFSKAKVIENIGLDIPESIMHDEKKDLYVVSNVGKHPTAEDGNGFISLINPDGTVKTLKWIDGQSEGVTLNTPKGMTIQNDKLYVADGNTLRIFDNTTGKPLDNILIEGTTFLNDVAVTKDGTIYVSESAIIFKGGKFLPTDKDAIYKITPDKKLVKWLSGKELQQPNGLELLDGNKLVTVTRGGSRLYVLDETGKKITDIDTTINVLDGLVMLPNNDYLVTSWTTSSVHRISGNKTTKEVKLPTPAGNIGYDKKRKTLLIPLLLKNKLAFMKVE